MSEQKNKIALITGGGQGLGEQITRVLADSGYTVIPADIKDEQVKKLAEELSSSGKTAEAMRLDVSDEASCKQTIDAIIKKYGRLDILINNAGIDFTKSIGELSIREWDKVLAVNLRGPFILSKLALEQMEKQKSGQIVNICSTAALRAWPNTSAYHASKWGLRALSHALYTEAREKGVRVTAVIAGGMRTPFILERFPDTPLNKLQDPQNVAETVKFVLSVPEESIVPEVMCIPLLESSWP